MNAESLFFMRLRENENHWYSPIAHNHQWWYRTKRIQLHRMERLSHNVQFRMSICNDITQKSIIRHCLQVHIKGGDPWPVITKNQQIKSLLLLACLAYQLTRWGKVLPDDVSIRCLARVPRSFHMVARLVSRGWATAFTSPHLYECRRCVAWSPAV